MSDYSKCYGVSCDKRNSCIRYTSEARPKWQAYIIQQVSVPDTSKCRFFISNEEKENGNS